MFGWGLELVEHPGLALPGPLPADQHPSDGWLCPVPSCIPRLSGAGSSSQRSATGRLLASIPRCSAGRASAPGLIPAPGLSGCAQALRSPARSPGPHFGPLPCGLTAAATRPPGTPGVGSGLDLSHGCDLARPLPGGVVLPARRQRRVVRRTAEPEIPRSPVQGRRCWRRSRRFSPSPLKGSG